MQSTLLSAACSSVIAGNAYLHPDDRVLCTGDSITAPGTYQTYVKETLRLIYPETNITFLNLGSGGKGAEYGAQTLKMNMEPATLALFMFGVNDTGWGLSDVDAKVTNFVNGLQKAVGVTQAQQLPLIFLRETHFSHGANPSPDAFEVGVTRMLDKLQEAQATFASQHGVPMIDVRAAYQRALEKAWTKDPAYEFTPDIIHPAPAGQAAIAGEILRAFGAGLPLSPTNGPRGMLQLQRTKEVTLSLKDGAHLVAPDGVIPFSVSVQNQSGKDAEGKLLVVLAGQKFEKPLLLKAGNTTNADFSLPVATLAGRTDTMPVFMAFVGTDRYAADSSLFYYSQLQATRKAPVSLTASSFTLLHPEITPRTCPASAISVQRAGESFTIDFTWNDTTPVWAQPGFKDFLGNIVNAPLNVNAREGQACDAVEFFLDLRPMESIGRWTSNIDANPPGILRLGVYQELVEGKPIAKFITHPTLPANAVTLTAQGEHRYHLSIHAKAAGPCAGFSMRVTDNTILKTDSTQTFLLAGYPQYLGKDPMTFIQMSENEEGVLCRLGY